MHKPKYLFLSDHETAVDLLYYEAISRTIVKFISQSPDLPLTVGVHGDWGAGKSSILKMVSAGFDGRDGTLCIWFNGWTFEGFEDAKAVVIETLVTELKRARPTSTKVADAAKKVLRRVDWLKLAQKAGGLALTVATGIPSPEIVSTLYHAAKAFIDKPADHITSADVNGILQNASGFLKASNDENDSVPEQVHKFRLEFQELLDAAELKQLVVLIDDLDRCLPETAISTLEAIRLFLNVPKTAFVVAADEAMIEYSVRRHFPDLPAPTSGATSYARSYLEKLIHVPFRVPALGLAETRAYVTMLLTGAAIGEDDPQFVKLLDAAREDLRRPWQSTGLDRPFVRKALGAEIPAPIDEAIRVSEQIARLLADGTRGNPRQIKRFLNSLMLRKAIAQERGFGDDIQVSILAKVMLAERFIPEFYEHVSRIAAADSNGRVALIESLETETLSDEDKKTSSRLKGEPSTEADPWLRSEAVREWAAIAPPLAAVDLRPYVFVARDKRSFFAGVVTADHLELLTERLLGSAMAVRQVEQDIARLTLAEAEQVFDALRSRILTSENLTNAPPGIHGMALLVRKQSSLQRKLIQFLREIPTDKAGAWAATSWSACFSTPIFVSEFAAIQDGWANSAGNAHLKAAAGAVKKVKGTR